MPAIFDVIKPGVACSIQAQTRIGFRDQSISSAGPLDPWSAQQANNLVNNPASAPLLEIPSGPLQLLAQHDIAIAVTGSGFTLLINEEKQQFKGSYPLKKGQTLSINNTKDMGHGYLAVQGGFNADHFLTSQSTHLLLKRGGYQGRFIQKGDTLSSELCQTDFSQINSVQHTVKGIRDHTPEPTIRVLPGPEYKILDRKITENFLQHSWVISQEKSRMGIKLHSSVSLSTSKVLSPIPSTPSHAVFPGTLQLTAPEQCIALMNDCQTTGGYPRIASIIEADRGALAQLPTGTHIHFIPISLAEAHKAYTKKIQAMYRFKLACTHAFKNAIK